MGARELGVNTAKAPRQLFVDIVTGEVAGVDNVGVDTTRQARGPVLESAPHLPAAGANGAPAARPSASATGEGAQRRLTRHSHSSLSRSRLEESGAAPATTSSESESQTVLLSAAGLIHRRHENRERDGDGDDHRQQAEFQDGTDQ